MADQDPSLADLEEAGSVLLGPEERASIRILVIDDEPGILESCESVLTADGYKCECERKAEGASAALSITVTVNGLPSGST